MKIKYNSSTSKIKHYPITGDGLQQVLLHVVLDGDEFVFVSDSSTSQIYIMRIDNKFITDSQALYHGFNMSAIENKEQFNYLYNWFDTNFNYQDNKKGESVDV